MPRIGIHDIWRRVGFIFPAMIGVTVLGVGSL